MKQLILAAAFIAPLALSGQKKVIQAKIIESQTEGRHKVSGKAVTQSGDTIYFKMGYSGLQKAKAPAVGTWLTVAADSADRQRVWYRRKINIQNKEK